MIIDALRELALEKDYKEITVSDIVKRADIGRATFYAHFEDKNDLGRFLFNQLLMQIEQEIQTILNESESEDKDYQKLVPSLAVFRIAQDKHRWFKMNATNPEIGLKMLVPPLIKRVEKRLNTLSLTVGKDNLPQQISANFLVSGLIALLTDWVVADMPTSPEAMDAAYQKLARPTLDMLLGK
ncbi:TetR/AcrR family transcriptional regulator [Candidatus Leptofilum sp.]|uniref:TetR/AcrR family transcriptional regulator n=1 Tax=Candidatus Leptofilum sp. TaxID=3241576 RepID=UPI003B5BBA83